MFNLLTLVANILPEPPTGSPAEIAKNGITFFETWISRTGGLIAFIGAIKLAMSLKTDDEKEQMQSVFIMVSGFMITAAVKDLSIFNIPEIYTKESANAEFNSIVSFIGKWARRVGAVGMFLGSISFGFAIKDNNATTKVNALRGIVAGAVVIAISGIVTTFV